MRPAGIPNSRPPKVAGEYKRMVIEVPADLYAAYAAICYRAGQSVTAGITAAMRQDVNHDQAVGADIEQDAAIFPPKSVTRITARIERVVEGGEA